MFGTDGTIRLTGNPFVDTGLAVIAALAKLDDVKDLAVESIRKVHGDGSQVSSWNSSLKNFTMVFTSNSLLTNPSIKDKGKRVNLYKRILNSLLDQFGSEELPSRCEACGMTRAVDFDALCSTALAGAEIKEQSRFIGRDWFPLSGSLGSDAQALPTASRAVNLCAKCLFAVHYLPLGLILLDGRLAVFQSTSIEFWYELVRDIVNEVQSRIKAGIYDTFGAKEGSRAITRRLLGLFERLQRANRFAEVPAGTTLQVWRFTNSGASPECEIEEIPNPALVFLWRAVREGLREEIEGLIASEGKKERPLFRCITEGRDYFGLYPRGKRSGASPRLFILYQTGVCGRSLKVLAIACRLAQQGSSGLKANELKRLQREEAFWEGAVRNQFRRSMVDLAQQGDLTLEDYLGLFPLSDDASGIMVNFDGWNLIRYYLHHFENGAPGANGALAQRAYSSKINTVRYYAARIFNNYIEERGKRRFQSEVLDRMGHRTIGVSWLKHQFIILAEQYPYFTYTAWERLCKNDTGELFVSELLFQMRLLWSDWVRGSSLVAAVDVDFEAGSGLSESVETLLKQAFSQYVQQRGLERFHRDVLLRVRRKEIGLSWFRHRLTLEDKTVSSPHLSDEDWEGFLKDENGHSYTEERLFQMQLVVANLYRETK
jgi:CRISPR-associated protein Cst1